MKKNSRELVLCRLKPDWDARDAQVDCAMPVHAGPASPTEDCYIDCGLSSAPDAGWLAAAGSSGGLSSSWVAGRATNWASALVPGCDGAGEGGG